MLARLWLLLACVFLLTPPAAPPTDVVTTEHAPATLAEQEQRTIGADAEPYSSNVRAAEGAELVTVVARVLAVATKPPAGDGLQSAPACGAHRATGWTDLVQCRRWAGAQLLRHATPPPARA